MAGSYHHRGETRSRGFIAPSDGRASLLFSSMGPDEKFAMHDPAFNNAYFSDRGTAFLYAWGLDDTTGTQIALYGITFGAGKAMNSGTPANILTVGGSTDVELSPVTEFLNGGTSVDAIFVGGLLNASPNFLEANVTAGFPAGFSGTAGEGSGTSGIIVDNQSTSARAASIYFGVLASWHKRKLRCKADPGWLAVSDLRN